MVHLLPLLCGVILIALALALAYVFWDVDFFIKASMVILMGATVVYGVLFLGMFIGLPGAITA